jgi:gamma-butyrobetaine dioxygenase
MSITADTTATGSTAIPAVQVEIQGRTCAVRWADGTQSTFHHLWLRDNALELLHPSTGHRVVETSSIPDDVHPSEATIDPDGALRVVWAHDDHVSTFPAAWLHAHDYTRGVRRVRPEPVLWNASIGDALPRASYPALLADDRVRRDFLRGFVRYGVAVLHDVPVEPGTVLDVGAQFGEVRVTSWGRVFDVIALDDANSVAYTNLPLVTHTDEGYRDPAPTIQLQHFLRADATGGASTLVDGFRIADDLRREHPEHFAALCRTMLHFHFRDATAEHENDSPVIDVWPDGALRGIRFSNHSVRPFLLPPDEMGAFYAAYREFGRRRESDEYQLRIEMGAGDMYMVDNRRTMHGRTGFSSGGARHLQSCYIERDELVSRLTVLERRLTD